MSDTKSINEQGIESELLELQLIGEQETVLQQLLQLQSDIERQGERVAMAIDPIAEALATDGNASLEAMNHLKAQILLAHLQLDELEQVLDAID